MIGQRGIISEVGRRNDPYWGNVTLALPMNGANNSTVFRSLTGVAVTAYGNAKISTSQSKFDGSSGYFDGTGDYLQAASSSVFDFGTGDFTIEAWIYPTAFSGDKVIVSRYSAWATSVAYYFGVRAGTPNILIFRAGNTIPIVLNSNTGLVTNEWVHVAVTRSSNVTRLFVGGTLQTATHTGTVSISSTAVLRIGANNESTAGEFFTGYIDDLRITKGVARYTSTFTPQPYSYF